MNGFAIAARYLTIVPLPGRPRPLEDLGRAAPWFPLVGLALGAAVALGEQVAARLFPALLSALLAITLWKLLTGGLHLDGLADCLDGLVGHDVEQRLAIMRDSRIGVFGALGLIFVLLLEIVALAELPEAFRWRALLAAPTLGRVAPILLARLFPPAREHGQGAAFRARLTAAALPVALAAATVIAVAALGLAGLLATVTSVLAALAVGRYFAKRLSGVTGDVLGAAVEVTELVALLTIAAWAHLTP